MFYDKFFTFKYDPIISMALTNPSSCKYYTSRYTDSYGVQENKQEVINGETVCKLTIPLPGFPKENVSVKRFNDKLEVLAKYQDKKIEEVFYDPEKKYDLTKTKASYLNGLLTIIAPIKKDNEGTIVLIE